MLAVVSNGCATSVDADPPKGSTAAESRPGRLINIQRPALTQTDFDQHYGLQASNLRSDGWHGPRCDKISPSASYLRNKLLSFLPFLNTMRTYHWKQWLIRDTVSGISMGSINVPQGLGFALLCSVPPVYGLYSSLFPAAIYFFFGTSHHISVGTMAIICLMTGAVVEREFPNIYKPQNVTLLDVLKEEGAAETEAIEAEMAVKVGIATSLCLLMGLFQFLMGVLNLGIIATYMSSTFVHGFLSGTAYHILVSQLPSILGFRLTPVSGIGKVPLSLINIFIHIKESNPAEVVVSVVSICLLVFIKEFINVRFKKRLKMPIPAELIVLILAVVTSYLSNLHGVFGVRIVGNIPAGFPAPEVPPLEKARNYVLDAFFMAILSFTISISMAKMFATRHRYALDTNQEFLALGLSFGISSFFHCFAGAQAPPRAFIHEAVGGRTQLANLISSLLLVLVCLAVGPAFKFLPVCLLACIIVVAILPLFTQVRQFPLFWRVNKMDGIVWLITTFAVIFLDVMPGVTLGLAANVLLVLLQAQLAKSTVVSNVRGTEVYEGGLNLSTSVKESPGLLVLKLNAPLFFANIDLFKQQIIQSTINLTTPSSEVHGDTKGDGNDKFTVEVDSTSKTLVLDCSALTYVDFMGVAALKEAEAWCKDCQVNLVLAGCSRKLIEQLKAGGTFSDSDVSFFYPTVHDAVTSKVGTTTVTGDILHLEK